MEWIGLSAAAVLLARAVYTDIREGKIENRVIVTGLLSGLLLACLNGGVKGFLDSAKMAGVTLAVLLILFLIKGLGAGDVKLFCMLAVFFPGEVISIIVVSFLAGGVMAVQKMCFRYLQKEKVYVRHETMNFSIPIAVGTGIVIMMKYCR